MYQITDHKVKAPNSFQQERSASGKRRRRPATISSPPCCIIDYSMHFEGSSNENRRYGTGKESKRGGRGTYAFCAPTVDW